MHSSIDKTSQMNDYEREQKYLDLSQMPTTSGKKLVPLPLRPQIKSQQAKQLNLSQPLIQKQLYSSDYQVPIIQNNANNDQLIQILQNNNTNTNNNTNAYNTEEPNAMQSQIKQSTYMSIPRIQYQYHSQYSPLPTQQSDQYTIGNTIMENQTQAQVRKFLHPRIDSQYISSVSHQFIPGNYVTNRKITYNETSSKRINSYFLSDNKGQLSEIRVSTQGPDEKKRQVQGYQKIKVRQNKAQRFGTYISQNPNLHIWREESPDKWVGRRWRKF
eukprot:TRINITY_DN4810_c0_g1_i4.p1 TRINITY_DN4810_c0_g1~~TRINITY_DN4810_c0_g1_i4.p1  ORF type:complete len:272 (+),score=50.38 TRINITY_DN4810_c0_g1_i4:359-1174(+)